MLTTKETLSERKTFNIDVDLNIIKQKKKICLKYIFFNINFFLIYVKNFLLFSNLTNIYLQILLYNINSLKVNICNYVADNKIEETQKKKWTTKNLTIK